MKSVCVLRFGRQSGFQAGVLAMDGRGNALGHEGNCRKAIPFPAPVRHMFDAPELAELTNLSNQWKRIPQQFTSIWL